ncbi:hypothetical protein Cylst_4517 [Cylindrospermum stagnale PCC 7417]|uniref:Uncharacterized protein n=1 Tax=Cylindrospermum stagnale PCC 7417 TaxID=56107 RepID=K9X1V2_9NOST|nr:hypothetical protein Cylst_4517 [Cylindrospermum stagnale PCC 7417]
MLLLFGLSYKLKMLGFVPQPNLQEALYVITPA